MVAVHLEHFVIRNARVKSSKGKISMMFTYHTYDYILLTRCQFKITIEATLSFCQFRELKFPERENIGKESCFVAIDSGKIQTSI